MPKPLPYQSYPATEHTPNLVVDGTPNRSTVLSLTHAQGVPAPPGYAADLSAQMVFKYLDHPIAHAPAQAVTNDHFDQDGLVSVFALVAPDQAQRHRKALIAIAEAGDFATYQDRSAARASMVLWCYANQQRSPIAAQLTGTSPATTARILYEHLLPLLPSLITESQRYEPLWREEDARLSASEQAIRSGVVTIEEEPNDNLSVILIPRHLPPLQGHRFGTAGLQSPDLHPMAVHNASHGLRQLFIRGRHYRYMDRYESKVQLQSRRPPPRVDLRPLAQELSIIEPNATCWYADPPTHLTPELSHKGESGLTEAQVRGLISDHLHKAPAAFKLYAAS